jgi:hypothetical protein
LEHKKPQLSEDPMQSQVYNMRRVMPLSSQRVGPIFK